MTREEMRKATRAFVAEIMACDSVETARDIDRRLNSFFDENDVPDDCNEVLLSGFGESLMMMCGYPD